MTSGALIHEIILQAPDAGQDAVGQPVTTWTTFATVRAHIRDANGRQFAAAQAMQNAVYAEITIRYLPGVTPAMRVLHGTDVYDIESILGQDRFWLTLMCSRGKGTDSGLVGGSGLVEKVVPVDADSFGLSDSESAGILRKFTWASLKAALVGIFAPSAKGVTNGDAHDHAGGDGAQIAYSSLSGLPTLGSSASLNVGTTAGTVAAGDDSRIVAATPAETTTTIGALINGATNKSTPVDDDQIGIMDSAASNIWKKLSWAALKTALQSIFVRIGQAADISALSISGVSVISSSRYLTNTITDTRYNPGNFSFSEFSPNRLWYGNKRGFTVTWSDTTGITNSDRVLIVDQTDAYITFNMATVADPLSITVSGVIGATSNVYAQRLFLAWHILAFVNVTFEVQKADASWVSVPIDSTISTSSLLVSNTITSVAPYPASWNLLGIRVTLSTKVVTSGNKYLYGIGLYSPRTGAYPYLLYKGGDTMYGDLSTEKIIPRTANTYDIGGSGTAFSNLYLSSGLFVNASDATTNAVYTIATLAKNTSGTGAAGLGPRLVFAAKSSTTVDTTQADITATWTDATHATRKTRLALSATDSAGAREGVRVEADGSAARLGFFGVTAVVKPTALTTTVAAAPAGGTGTADGGWDTAGNRDLAIATINNLKTRVDQLETKLQALGLLT